MARHSCFEINWPLMRLIHKFWILIDLFLKPFEFCKNYVVRRLIKKREIDNLLLFAKPDLKSFGSGKYFGGFRQFLPLIAWSKLSTNWKLARIFSRETEWENYCGLVAATTRGFIPLKSVRFLKKCLHDLHFKLSSYILRRPQNFAKSPPCFALCSAIQK